MKDKILFYSQSHIDGISKDKEHKNWKAGILSQEDLIKTNGTQISMFGTDSPILESVEALKNDNIEYYKNALKKQDYYRIAYSYPEKVIFLDIETTGLSRIYSYITVIGWMKNMRYKHCLYGNRVTELVDDLKESEIIITFNGELFDLPFLKEKYHELSNLLENKIHIDLRFFLKRYGYMGGQKHIEDLLHFKRPKALNGTDGKEAVSLWYRFLNGDIKSLKRLLYYNCYDILGMAYLFDFIFYHKIYGKEIPIVGKPRKFSRRYCAEFVKFNMLEIKNARKRVCEKVTFFKHHSLENTFSYKILGIDLTGSEMKKSGCAIIEGNQVQTFLLGRDDDLLDCLLKNEIDLVSIDSPLSLPKGRNSVFDDDPLREEIGIMRISERILKKRGVNVYPALIPSMQKLTKRGIELSKKIRKLGIPVIESFPGAAQDVLQIPRKKTDLFFLKQGLIDFGLDGEFKTKRISHDELDAITSALVGQFFISDYFEQLGDVNENFLIIPSMKKKNGVKQKIIGLCGPVATGKTELAKYIEKKGYHYVRYSMIIEEYLREQGIEINRENLQKHGLDIFCKLGQYWLNRRLISKVENSPLIVVDGLRHPEDIAFLKEYNFIGFKAIFIESSYENRKKRFEKLEGSEYEKVVGHSVEKNVMDLEKLVDVKITNNGTLKELFKKIDKEL